MRKAADELQLREADLPTERAGLAALVHPDELAIVALLAEFPEVVDGAAAARAPNKIVAYLTTLAQSFQSYYTRLKNEGDTILPRTSEREGWRERDGGAYLSKVRARLAWVRAIRDVYAAGLLLLGISAPERMQRPAATESLSDDEAVT